MAHAMMNPKPNTENISENLPDIEGRITPSQSVALHSADVIGFECPLLEVEVHAARGLPHVDIVGLAETCVRESKQRVRAAITASGYEFPDSKITINLAPASIKKVATGLDLPMALGILLASERMTAFSQSDLKQTLFVGELSLSGNLRPMGGLMNVVMMAREHGFKQVVLPKENLSEASLVSGIGLLGASHLKEVIFHLTGEQPLQPFFLPVNRREDYRLFDDSRDQHSIDDVRGQTMAKKALVLAAAGGHNLLFIGPPGSGKTLLAHCMQRLLPDLSSEESLAVTRLYACAGLIGKKFGLVRRPPFRSPHHSLSDAGLIGGGRGVLPGEISLAHEGILFLDELPEFKRHVLEVLREPMEHGSIFLARAAVNMTYPARFQLIAAMNPCPCGFFGVDRGRCRCSATGVRQYTQRISGPLLDRIDLKLALHPVAVSDFFQSTEIHAVAAPFESEEKAKAMVARAWDIQAQRFAGLHFRKNAHIPPGLIDSFCPISAESREVFQSGIMQMKLSGRGVHRILRVARTMADLSQAKAIEPSHLREAFEFFRDPFEA